MLYNRFAAPYDVNQHGEPILHTLLQATPSPIFKRKTRGLRALPLVFWAYERPYRPPENAFLRDLRLMNGLVLFRVSFHQFQRSPYAVFDLLCCLSQLPEFFSELVKSFLKGLDIYLDVMQHFFSFHIILIGFEDFLVYGR